MSSSEAGRELARTTDGEFSRAEQQLTKLPGVELIVDANGNRELTVGADLAQRVNLCCPITATVQVDPNWRPMPVLVELKPEDFFSPGKFKRGERWVEGFTPSSKALAELAHAAGITLAKTKYNRFPGGVEVTAIAMFRGADGIPRTEERSRVVRFAEHEERMRLQSLEKHERALQGGNEKWKKDAKAKAEADGPPSEKQLRKNYLDDMEFIDAKLQSLSDDAPVLTTTGWSRMGDIEVGDLVIGSNGMPTPVLGVYPQGEKDLYRVEFTDGATVDCTDDHLWTVTCNNWKGRGEGTKTLTLAEMRGFTKPFQVQVLSAPAQFMELPEPEVDPWLVGALLGDGCFRERMITFACTEEAMLERARSVLPVDVELVRDSPVSCRFRAREYVLAHAAGPGRAAHSLLGWARECQLTGKRAWEKRVPSEYLYGSVADRLALLRGLADTDGTVGQYGRASITTTSPGLAEDIRHLVGSLGGRARTHRYANARKAYRVQFRIPGMVPFLLPRKVALYEQREAERRTRGRGSNDDHWHTIRSIMPMSRGRATCIGVAAADGLFLTAGFVPTHNTKAFSRCVRALLGIGPMTQPETQKPFLVLAWIMTPDYSDPGTRELLRVQYATSVADLYGPGEEEAVMQTEGPKPVAQLRHGDDELDPEERAEILDAPGEGPPPTAEEPATIEGGEFPADPGDDMEPGDAPPKPPAADAFLIRSDSQSGFAGKGAEEMCGSPEGRAHLVGMVKATTAEDKKRQILAWLSWLYERPLTLEDLDLEKLEAGLDD